MIKDYQAALDYLDTFKADKSAYAPMGVFGLERCRYLMNILGNPQNTIPAIHMAATSGKGSTTHIISKILVEHGLQVGLHQTPIISSELDYIQIQNAPITTHLFSQYLNEIAPQLSRMSDTPFGNIRYFEAVLALVYWSLNREKMDVNIMETSLGGLYDCTNTISSRAKICILGRIGLDHQRVLGETIEEITLQKCGIFQYGNTVIALKQSPHIDEIIAFESGKLHCPLYWVEVPTDMEITPSGSDFVYDTVDYSIPLLGTHQVENTYLALKASQLFLGTQFDSASANSGLSKCDFRGRLSTIQLGSKTVWVDGAHNAQKMTALVDTLLRIFPRQKFDIVLAVKEGKDTMSMIDILSPITKSFMITEYSNDSSEFKQCQKPHEIANIIYQKFPDIEVIVEPNTRQALQLLTQSANPHKLITGSLYLVADVYNIH
jgi:dihydrofolate synthase / folylpolyglutamate synthase